MFERIIMGAMMLLCMTEPLAAPQAERVPPDELMLRFTDAFQIYSVFGNCGRPCIVHTSNGGYVINFELAADALVHSGSKLVIDGDCYSACAVAADRIRADTCITPRAAFHFHQSSVRSIKRVADRDVEVRSDFSDPPQSRAIAAWVNKHGGYPKDGFLTMHYAEAKKFWQTCGRGTPLPKPDPRRAKARRPSYELYTDMIGYP